MKTLSITLEAKELLETYAAAGANEVLVALKDQTFSALQEFDPDEIETIAKDAHAKNMKVSVLMNRLYDQSQIEAAQDTMEAVLAKGADYIMFADPGLMRRAVEKNLQAHMIYRPETLMTSFLDAGFWMEQGIASVMIPSLLTKEEVTEIAREVKDTSAIIHGHTLMSVSKRRLLQAYADATKKDIQLEGKRNLSLREKQREDHMPAYENAYAMMIYNDFVQSSFREMKEFMDAGIMRYEIDTPFMNTDAAVDALKIYRAALDGEEWEEMAKAYETKYASAHLSDGYYGQKTVK